MKNLHPDFADFLVETGNPRALDETLQAMGAVLIGGPDHYAREDGYYVMRAFNPNFVKFACKQQGYCQLIRETRTFRVDNRIHYRP